MYEIITKAQNGCEESMTKIIEENTGLVWSIVNRFSFRGYPKEDLYQIGCMGLIKAIKRFDITMDVKISTYAVPYIMGEIKRFLRDDGPIKISRSIKELATKIGEIQKKYLNISGEELTIEKLSKELNVGREEIIQAMEISTPIESINESVYGDENTQEKLEILKPDKDETEDLVNKMCLKNMIGNLDEKERKIIILRYYKDKTQSEVAKIMGVSQVQISRIEKQVLLGMRRNMQA